MPDFFFACVWIGLLIYLRNEKKQCAKCGWIAKSVTEKNNSRVDCAEAIKKTVQAQRYEGRGFFIAGDYCPAELPVIILQAKPDRFYKILTLKNVPLAVLTVCKTDTVIFGEYYTYPTLIRHIRHLSDIDPTLINS